MHTYMDGDSNLMKVEKLLMMQGARKVAMPAATASKLVVLVVVVAATIGSVSGEEHFVGGNRYNGWGTDHNYTEWSSKKRFYVGDWLYFGFERSKRQLYSVLQVNKTSYENCDTEYWIKNATGGAGRDVFQLTEPTTYYFISRGGFCFHGMKLAVLTQNLPPPPPPVQPPLHAKNGSPTNFCVNNMVIIALITSYLFNFW